MDRQQGSLTPEQLELILRFLPLDLSFADEHDVLVYWHGETYEDCEPQWVGRDVRDCHPRSSLACLEDILARFKSGEKDIAEGWRQDADGFHHTRYCAVRDANGAYRGILEVNQDLTGLRALEGTRALPGW